MSWLMGLIYTGISWILLRWHEFWDLILPDGSFLGTTWDWVLAVVFLVITVRIILFPIFVKQIRSQRAMQALQPKMKELQAKHKGDQQTLREEMMKLYQTEKVNPLMGCLPLFLQIPVFFGLFHVLKGLNPANPATRELYGWTGEAWDSAVLARLFTAPLPAHFASDANELAHLDASGVVVKIVAGVLVLIMMVTTFLTSRQMILKTGWSQDPQQRMIQKLMLYGIPFTLLLSGWAFPIGVIIYWVTQNIFSLGQQYWVLHKYPPPVTEGSTPLKSLRKGTTGTVEKKTNPFLRFIQVQPKEPQGKNGFLSPVQTGRGGLFRRRTVTAAPPAAPEARSLAPRPGAKPIKSTPPAAPNGSSSAESTDTTDTTGATDTPAPPTSPSATGAARTKVVVSEGKGGAAKAPSANGASSTASKSSSNGASNGGSGGASSGAESANGGQAAKPAAARSKSAAPRKGPANKKGGRKR